MTKKSRRWVVGPATYISAQVRGKMVGDEHSTSERTLSLREYKALAQNARPGPPEDQEDETSVFMAGRVLHARHVPLAGIGLRC